MFANFLAMITDWKTIELKFLESRFLLKPCNKSKGYYMVYYYKIKNWRFTWKFRDFVYSNYFLTSVSIGQSQKKILACCMHTGMMVFQQFWNPLPRLGDPVSSLLYHSVPENPSPEQGPVITVKLSEHTEISTAPILNTPQTQLVEMLFEMNYDTGHWRRLKRTRVVARQHPVQDKPQ